MGAEQEKSEKIQQDFVTFELIQDTLGLKNPILFTKYLREVFNDLSNALDKEGHKLLTRMTFYDYIKLPIFIAEKLFSSFSVTSKAGLSETEFVNGFFKLYMGNFEETTGVIFNLIDFNKDGKINKEDAKIILSYLPIHEVKEEKHNKIDLVNKIFGQQIKSLEEIDTIVSEAFDKYGGEMDLAQFTEIATEKNSEIFLQILCFLYEQIPFGSKNIEVFKKNYNLTDNEYEKISTSFRRSKKSGSIKIKTPKYGSLLSPAGNFLKQFNRRFSLNEEAIERSTLSSSGKSNKVEENKEKESNKSINSSLMVSTSPSFSFSENDKNMNEINMQIEENINKKNDPYNKNVDIVRLNNENILEGNQSKLEPNENIKDLVNRARKGYSSPSKYLQDKNYMNHMAVNHVLFSSNSKNFDTQLREINESDDENEKMEDVEKNKNNIIINKDNDNNVIYENWVYKITESNKIKKFYLVLVNKDTFYYKSEKKEEFVGMHNLSGCFVQDNCESKIFNNVEYSSFEIYSKNKSKVRKYYTTSPKIAKEFIEHIKKAIGYVKFSDLYEMKEVIGKGKFGVVNLGIHRKTGQQVAIKILNKENIKTLEDKELVQIEIGILKLCHHPNIVRLLDHLENTDYIYIVTEFIEGGTLGQYFKKKKFNFSERQAMNIMSQLASGVKYLHQYGIVHRDLKPDNIMITQQNEYGVIKIMDFGLSKIVSPHEKMVDGYGTLSYVAPEVLLRTPYNKEVDIWSMGVILFYMLSGRLPFRGSKEQEVAEKIVYEQLEFDEDDWETRTQKVQDLISCCLEKKAEDRIKINQFLNHPWFKKNMKPKLSM
jgi:hypothetical protein